MAAKGKWIAILAGCAAAGLILRSNPRVPAAALLRRERNDRPDAMSDQTQFHLEEYKALRSEIVAQGIKFDQLKIWMLAVLGAFYAWTASNIFGSTPALCLKMNLVTVGILLAIPVFIATVATMSAGYFIIYFRKMGAYFHELEQLLGLPGYGWERRYRAGDAHITDISRNVFLTAFWSDAFWFAILPSAVVMSAVIFYNAAASDICVAAPPP